MAWAAVNQTRKAWRYRGLVMTALPSQPRAGQSVEVQKEVLRSLGELLDRLAGRRENELDRRNRKLDEAESSLQDLQRKQQQLTNRLRDAAGWRAAETVAAGTGGPA